MKKRLQNRRDFIGKSLSAAAAFTIVPRFVLGKGYIAPSDQFPIVFIGTGKQGRGLVRRFVERDVFQVIGAADVEKNKLKWFTEICSEQYQKHREMAHDISVFEDYQELLNLEDVEGVVVATPDHWHALPTIQSMKAGKHVFCEKPLSHTIEEGRLMVKAARKYNRILQTGSMQRSWENFRHACELIRNGYIGRITEILVSVGDPRQPCDLPTESTPDYVDWNAWLGPAPMRGFNAILSPPVEEDIFPKWRSYSEYGGGQVADWGAHMFDIAQWAIGMDSSGPVEINPPQTKGDVRGVSMTYENGIVMKHEDFDRGNAVRFIGTEGTLDVSRSFLETTPESIAKAKIKDSEVRLYKSDDHYLDWVESVRKNRLPVADVEIGHRTATICHLVNICYELNRPLSWDPKKEKFKGDKEANQMRTKEYRRPFQV